MPSDIATSRPQAQKRSLACKLASTQLPSPLGHHSRLLVLTVGQQHFREHVCLFMVCPLCQIGWVMKADLSRPMRVVRWLNRWMLHFKLLQWVLRCDEVSTVLSLQKADSWVRNYLGKLWACGGVEINWSLSIISSYCVGMSMNITKILITWKPHRRSKSTVARLGKRGEGQN